MRTTPWQETSYKVFPVDYAFSSTCRSFHSQLVPAELKVSTNASENLNIDNSSDIDVWSSDIESTSRLIWNILGNDEA